MFVGRVAERLRIQQGQFRVLVTVEPAGTSPRNWVAVAPVGWSPRRLRVARVLRAWGPVAREITREKLHALIGGAFVAVVGVIAAEFAGRADLVKDVIPEWCLLSAVPLASLAVAWIGVALVRAAINEVRRDVEHLACHAAAVAEAEKYNAAWVYSRRARAYGSANQLSVYPDGHFVRRDGSRADAPTELERLRREAYERPPIDLVTSSLQMEAFT